jgi:hypothetical protein
MIYNLWECLGELKWLRGIREKRETDPLNLLG